MLPTFIVIGAMKAGTTSLASYLGAHPQVHMTDPKEPRYFTSEHHRGLDWYESLFDGSECCLARGEASTDYTKAPQVESPAGRIHALVPDAKLVYVVRNPVERIRSQYVHRAARFNEAKIEREPVAQTVKSKPMYLDWSRYGYQLEQYLEHFPREQMLVVSSERLRDDRVETVREIFTFVGVDPDVEITSVGEELNQGLGKRRMPRWVRPVRRLLWRAGVFGRLSREQRIALQRWFQRQEIVAEVPPELQEWIWEQLADDLRFLREFVGPEPDLWGRA